MIKIIKFDPSLNKDNQIINTVNGAEMNMIDRSNPDQEIKFIGIDNKEITVPSTSIKEQYAGMLYIDDEDGNRYMFDDGYEDMLVSAGYVVLNDYDKNLADKNEGVEIQNEILKGINSAISELNHNTSYQQNTKYSEWQMSNNFYDFTIRAISVDYIVRMNEKRKINDLPYYPYIKGMDKYGTIYLCCFAKMKPQYTAEMVSILSKETKKSFVDNIFSDIIKSMNKNGDIDTIYHFEPTFINKIIIKADKGDV